MKKILLFTLVILSSKLFSYDFKYEELYYNIINDSVIPYEVEVVKPDTLSYEQSIITIPNSVHYDGKTYTVTSIGEMAFSFCKKLTDINISSSITNIGRMAFMYCSSLKKITIPNSVRKIGYMIFYGEALEYVHLGNGLKEIEPNFFCTPSLRSVTIEAKNPPKYEKAILYFTNELCNTVYVPKESLYKYANAEGWKEFGRILPIGGDGSVGVFKPDFDPKNKVKGVAGCSFGCDSKQAINHFNNKFGYYAINNSYETTYADVYFAGYYFDIMELQFVDNKPKQRKDFASIEFQKIFDANDYEAAKRCFESIRKMYSEKYSNEREYEEGWYMYGMIEEDYHNTVPPIILGIEKGVGGDGNERYYIMIHYYGFRTLDRYSDDI